MATAYPAKTLLTTINGTLELPAKADQVIGGTSEVHMDQGVVKTLGFPAENKLALNEALKPSEDDQAIDETLILLQELMELVRNDAQINALQTSILLLEETLESLLESEADMRTVIKYHLLRVYLTRFGLYGWIEDWDKCYQNLESLSIRRSMTNEDITAGAGEVQLASQMLNDYRNSLNIEHIDTIICVSEQAFSSHVEGASTRQRAKLLTLFGKALVMRYLSKGEVQQLDQAASKFREVQNLCNGRDPLGYVSLISLGHIAVLKLNECRPSLYDSEVAQEADNCLEMAAVLEQEGVRLTNLGTEMLQHAVDESQLQKAITCLYASLHHFKTLHPRREYPLTSLTTALFDRFEWRDDLRDLEASIRFAQELVALTPPCHPNRSRALGNLARSIYGRFRKQGNFQDLEDCIALQKEALDSANTEDRPQALNNLGHFILFRLEKQWNEEDIRVAIALLQEGAPFSLMGLGRALFLRFSRSGLVEDLDESIACCREALQRWPAPNPDRWLPLNNLAIGLLARFEQKGLLNDLEECIELNREALSGLPAAHIDRQTVLNGLASALHCRFTESKILRDLDEAIALHREALNLRSATDQTRQHLSLLNLSSALQSRFNAKSTFQDIEECIALNRKGLNMLSPDHPDRPGLLNSLSSALAKRFYHRENPQDLEESISLLEQMLSWCPIPHPGRLNALYNLGIRLILKAKHRRNYADVKNALKCFENASKYETGKLMLRFHASRSWAACARILSDDPALTLEAYRYAIGLLPLLASLDLTLEQRRDLLCHSQNIVGEATKCAIHQNQFEAAVEFLSTGRSVFWSQALELRTPVDELAAINPALAERFRMSSAHLEQASHTLTNISQHPSPQLFNNHRSGSQDYHSLTALVDQRRQAIEDIRKIQGYEDFLVPPPFVSLQRAAREGPVILLNASEQGCDALIMHGAGPVQHVPLLMLTSDCLQAFTQIVNMFLVEGMRSIDIPCAIFETLQKHLPRDMVLESSTKGDSSQNLLGMVLGSLWLYVVQPVIKVLGIEKTYSPRRRIWWCPAGSFARLPIHAAGLYSPDSVNVPIDCLFHYAVSSYCASPQDLLHPSPQISTGFRMTAIIEPEAPGAGLLPATLDELVNIENRVPNRDQLNACLGLRSAPNHIDKVLLDIGQSSFVHFGCHGTQNLKNPLESCMLLSGGKLTMSKIIRGCKVREGALAYLSACETAKGDGELPDESLNLVATMMFAGFRSVIGTIWPIYDADAPLVADVFYSHIFRDGNKTPPDVRDAAYGLHLATEKLRESGRSLGSWVPYVHYGI